MLLEAKTHHTYKVLDKEGKRIEGVISYDTKEKCAIMYIATGAGWKVENGELVTQTVNLPGSYAVDPEGKVVE